jgi:TolB protein
LKRAEWIGRKARAAAAVVALAAWLPGVAAAQVTGRIVQPGATRMQIAVSPLAGDDRGAGQRFSEILSRNLILSGFFQVVDPKAYIEGSTPVALEQINFGSWRSLGAAALIKGTIAVGATGIEVEARMYDVYQQSQVGGQRYHASEEDLPRVARRFADAVLKYVTGETGPFDSRIGFVSRRAGRAKEVFAMSVDGYEMAQLTSNRTINLAPSWHPEASSILFTSFKDGNPSLYRLDLVSRAEQRLSAIHGLNLGGRWSPDGRRIAISLERNGNADIFLLDTSGQVVKQLTSGPEIDVSPSWSPDGSRIAFVSSRAGGPQIYVMGADGSGQQRLTFEGSYNTSPSWSPKGGVVAYVSRDRGFNIFTVDVGSRQAKQLTSGQGNNEDPSFSPDGRYLVFSSTRLGKPVLFLTDVAGAHQVQLTKTGGDDTSPAWSPRLP